MVKRLAAALVVLTVLATTLPGCLQSKPTGKAPDLQLRNIDTSGAFKLSDYAGKVIVLDFMATWCGACKQEMPVLKEVYDRVGGNVVMISIDVDEESTEEMKNFKSEYGADWTFASSEDDSPVQKYQIEYIPKIVIINANFDVSFSYVGTLAKEKILDEIEKAY
ncbi:MAG: TlpA disulfide reductase family protein [Candidatus Thermoplasmatota archaeon]|nr:TlpA disulfide reductase family protein [Candidatus Thermoplasmatota archaeon]